MLIGLTQSYKHIRQEKVFGERAESPNTVVDTGFSRSGEIINGIGCIEGFKTLGSYWGNTIQVDKNNCTLNIVSSINWRTENFLSNNM